MFMLLFLQQKYFTADLFQFGKYSTDPARIPVESYDFWSIMHYGSYYLSSNGAATMTDLDGNVFRTQVSCESIYKILRKMFLEKTRSYVS